MNCLYKRYRDTFNKYLNEDPAFLDSRTMDKWARYLCKRICSEETFPLYYYSKYMESQMNPFKLYISSYKNMNDIYDGVGGGIDDCDNMDFTEKIVNLTTYAYLKCFSESFNHNLMWGHYGDNFKGICIEYDFSQIPQESFLWKHFFPIKYTKNREKQIDYDLIQSYCKDGDFDGIYETLGPFTQKGRVWSYEREWRLTFLETDIKENEEIKKHVSGTGKDKHLEIQFDYVKRIYLGPGLILEKDNAIEQFKLCKKQNSKVEIYQMLINPSDTFSLDEEHICDI